MCASMCYVNIYMCYGACVCMRTTYRSLFSPYTHGFWIKVMSSYLATHTFIKAISLALCILF